MRLGVLVSGRGSNLQSILDACQARAVPAEVALVLSNVPGALALEGARKAGVPTAVLEHASFATRADFDRAAVQRLREQGAELVCLAGFMRILSPAFLSSFSGRVLNIHPSLLPAFPGLHGARQALEARVRVAGCTVHFVDDGCDTGPILAQAAVPVFPDDSEETLGARILEQEHRIYPLAIGLVASGKARLEGGRVVCSDARWASGALLNPLPASTC
jgi:phosphoribosylglycinamide formyltransferase-1